MVTPVLVVFIVMALFTVVGGLGVVSSRNLIHAAMFLILALFGVSGLYILLEAPFLAAVQILVYLGAIAVLITITVMVTQQVAGEVEPTNPRWPWALVVAALTLVTLGFVIWNQFRGTLPVADVPADNLSQLGLAFGNSQAFALPFEVASVLLLAALIGSIVVARD